MRFYLLIPGGNSSLYQEVIYNSKYYPCGLERLSILDLHCRLGLYRRSSRNRAKDEFKKRVEANSTKKKTGHSKNKSGNLHDTIKEQIVIAESQTYSSFGCFWLTCLFSISKIARLGNCYLVFLGKKVSGFSFAPLKLCMVTLLRYGYLVDNS